MRVYTTEFVVSAGRPDQFPRGAWPEVAFAGRSNVGKSSMINRLLGRRRIAHVSATPGRTRTINFYRVNDAFLFVDLPGYGYAKVARAVKDAWWNLVETFLTERRQLRGVIHILDARHPPTLLDRELETFLAAVDVPSLVVLTKADKVGRGDRRAVQRAAAESLGLPSPDLALCFSAETGEGVRELWGAMEECLRAPARVTGRPGGRSPGAGSTPDSR
jgi:GTP-binding protein